jgi:hypothetical protein
MDTWEEGVQGLGYETSLNCFHLGPCKSFRPSKRLHTRMTCDFGRVKSLHFVSVLSSVKWG